MWSRWMKHLIKPEVIDYLANTYPIRRAAQITVGALFRLSEKNSNVKKLMETGTFPPLFKSIGDNIRKQATNIKREIEKPRKKD